MSITDRLARLVAFDTQNPGGDERPLVRHLANELREAGARDVAIGEIDAHAWVYARFGAGRPTVLVNAHVDTVPANAGYTAAPHVLRVTDGSLIGLGTADTKGAIAAFLAALDERRASGAPVENLAVLFSGDEERRGTCIRAFLADPANWVGLRNAVVCEPTGCTVGWRHRGIVAIEASTTSPGGHSSLVDTIPSPIAVLARAAVALDDMGRAHRSQGPDGFPGLCLNIAALDGGLAFNVIPSRATLRASFRPAPGADVQVLLTEAESRARAAAAPHQLGWSVSASNPPFQSRDTSAFVPLLGAPARQPVDLGFWTEAALFSEVGINAVVYGPGRVEQAHAPDEHVPLAELELAQATFANLIAATAAPNHADGDRDGHGHGDA